MYNVDVRVHCAVVRVHTFPQLMMKEALLFNIPPKNIASFLKKHRVEIKSDPRLSTRPFHEVNTRLKIHLRRRMLGQLSLLKSQPKLLSGPLN